MVKKDTAIAKEQYSTLMINQRTGYKQMDYLAQNLMVGIKKPLSYPLLASPFFHSLLTIPLLSPPPGLRIPTPS